MIRLIPQHVRITALVLIMLELLSFFGWADPRFGNILFFLVLALAAYLSFRDLRFGIGIILAELIIGSHGYLFSFQAGETSLSLRLGLFAAVIAAALYRIYHDRSVAFYHSKLFWPYAALAAAFAWAVLNGVIQDNGPARIFADANGYLFFALAIPFWQAIRNRSDVLLLFEISSAALLVSLIKVFFLEYAFSHRLWWMLQETYRWVRDTRVGEITELYGESFHRIFLQSQLYTIAGFFILLLLAVGYPRREQLKQSLKLPRFWGWFLFGSCAFGSILISFSRSNWVGMAAAAIMMPVVFYLSRQQPWRQTSTSFVTWGAMGVVSLLLITVTVLLPFPPSGGGFNAGGLISQRALTVSDEAAVSSRWQLLDPLWQEIKGTAILGAGFGETVTYITDDPRIREQNPSGEYTTFTFEWGYLDLWLKFGLIGWLIYAAFAVTILWLSYRALRSVKDDTRPLDRILIEGTALGGIALLTIHFFSPYLNHPLGIGYLLFWAVVVERLTDVTDSKDAQTEEMPRNVSYDLDKTDSTKVALRSTIPNPS